jgi:hypothetical protein
MRLGKISPVHGHCQPIIDIFCGANASANVSKILCIEQFHWLLEGIDLTAMRKHPERRYARA